MPREGTAMCSNHYMWSKANTATGSSGEGGWAHLSKIFEKKVLITIY